MFGVAVILAGVVLATVLSDVRVIWFEGRPFGLLLIVLGAVEVFEEWRRRSTRG